MEILFFCGSLRKDSFNKKLQGVAEKIVGQVPGCTTIVADIKALGISNYDGDIEAERGIPAVVTQLGQMVRSANGVIITSPEYNGSISGPLKNTIDWLSRLTPHPIGQKPILLLGASPGALGAIRALTHSRVPLDTLGAYVYSQNFGLAKAHEAFTPEGNLIDPNTQKRLTGLIVGYLDFVKKLTGASAT